MDPELIVVVCANSALLRSTLGDSELQNPLEIYVVNPLTLLVVGEMLCSLDLTDYLMVVVEQRKDRHVMSGMRRR